MSDRLRLHWDFGDLDATERRLRAALAEEPSDAGRAEVLTQLARVDGLRGEFDAADRVLDEAVELAAGSAVACARLELERGRVRRSSGDVAAALPHFESAFRTAETAREWFVAGDAAHMAALASANRQGLVSWTERGLALGEQHEEAAYWAGPLLNNLGWELYEAGEHGAARDAFERALRVRERDPTNEEPIALARFAVGKTLRALGRSEEAIHLVEQAVAWASVAGKPDGWYHEELAEEYAATGRGDDASAQARLALPLLERDDPSFVADAERAARLRSLAG